MAAQASFARPRRSRATATFQCRTDVSGSRLDLDRAEVAQRLQARDAFAGQGRGRSLLGRRFVDLSQLVQRVSEVDLGSGFTRGLGRRVLLAVLPQSVALRPPLAAPIGANIRRGRGLFSCRLSRRRGACRGIMAISCVLQLYERESRLKSFEAVLCFDVR